MQSEQDCFQAERNYSNWPDDGCSSVGGGESHKIKWKELLKWYP